MTSMVFHPELYQLEYPAMGSPELAQTTADLINSGGIHCKIDYERGLDHGAWVPSMLMFPDMKVPIFQLSIQQHMDPKAHLVLGDTINSLRR